LSPGWAVSDLLSGLTSVANPLATSESNESEFYRQQDPFSGYPVRAHPSPHRDSTLAVGALVPSLVETSATISDSVWPDPPDPLKEPASSSLGLSVIIGPPRPRRLLASPDDSVCVVMGSDAPHESLHVDTAYVPLRSSRPHGVPPQRLDAPGFSVTNSHSTEGVAANIATSARYKEYTSNLLGHLSQLPSPFSIPSSGSTTSNVPLFFPSQTPNRHPSSQDILSPQAAITAHKGESSSKTTPTHSKGNPHNDHPGSDLSNTPALQCVDDGIHLSDEGYISSLHGISLPSRCLTASKSPLLLEWPNRFGINACPQTPSTGLNERPSRYQSAGYPNSLDKRRGSSGSGCITHEAIPSGFSLTQRDLAPSEILVRGQNLGNCTMQVDTWIPKAPKQVEHSIAPVHAAILDAPFSTPSSRLRRTRTPSLLARSDFSGHKCSSGVGERQTDPFKASGKGWIPRPERSSCTLPNPSYNAPKSDPGQNASFLRTSRPSVIVYKVATGPNLARSKDVIRVSYGEGQQRNRNRKNRLGHSSKTHDLGHYNSPLKKHDKAKRGGMAKHSGRKLSRTQFCLDDRRASPAGQKAVETMLSSNPPSAERVEGDMAWDFGVSQQASARHVDVHRPQVRVGGLTSVRMIPRTVVLVEGEISPGANRLAK
jgi:hypothetical protein